MFLIFANIVTREKNMDKRYIVNNKCMMALTGFFFGVGVNLVSHQSWVHSQTFPMMFLTPNIFCSGNSVTWKLKIWFHVFKRNFNISTSCESFINIYLNFELSHVFDNFQHTVLEMRTLLYVTWGLLMLYQFQNCSTLWLKNQAFNIWTMTD